MLAVYCGDDVSAGMASVYVNSLRRGMSIKTSINLLGGQNGSTMLVKHWTLNCISIILH